MLASGCIEGIVVDEQRQAATAVDAALGTDEEDGDISDPEPEPEPRSDASMPMPAMDAGTQPMPRVDAGRDAGGRDAGRDAGGRPPDAGSTQDAGCVGAQCDAGTPPGPCASCGVVSVSLTPTDVELCDNGALQVCWTNPHSDCSIQCPTTGSCTKDDPNACGPGRYCYFPKSDCGESSAGFCATPRECSNITVPACGCDGVTYQNPCFAAVAGTAVYQGLASEHCK
jgi:hypothetical protein